MTHIDQNPANPQQSGAVSAEEVSLTMVALAELRPTYPVSELLGRHVINDVGEPIGPIDDLMVDDDRLAFAILSVGGFLGIGAHQVVVAFDDLLIDGDDVVLPGASKQALKEMTAFDGEEVRKERNPLRKPRRGKRDASEIVTSAAGEPIPGIVADVTDGDL
jgi:hypothetical protein